MNTSAPTLGAAAALTRLAHGPDAAAWAALVTLHGDEVLRLCHRILGERAIAQDACQDTFLAARLRAASFAPQENPDADARSWILSIARNLSFTCARARSTALRHRSALAMTTAASSPSLEDDSDLPDAATVAHEVARLDPRQREAVALHFYQGLGYDAVARSLGCSVGNARVIVHRGLEALRRRLGRTGRRVTAVALVAAFTAHAQAVETGGGGAFLAELASHPPIAPALPIAAASAWTMVMAASALALAVLVGAAGVAHAVGAPRRANSVSGIVTLRRMDDVLTNLQLVGAAEGTTAYDLRRLGMGIGTRWSTLRTVLSTATDPGRPDDLPPNLKLRSVSDVASPSDDLLAQRICWLVRDPDGAQTRRGPGSVIEGTADFYTDEVGHPFPSTIGESLDRTLEAIPPGPVPTQWYRDAWPTLSEQRSPDGTVVATAWPPTDWDRDTPGHAVPVWPSPWGRPALRRDGTLAASPEAHALGEFSPLQTIALLQVAGALPSGEAGAQAYRSDRGSARPWNDARGNPLIVVCAAFLPPRYDFTSGETNSRQLQGGRDFLLSRAKELYGCDSEIYVAVAASDVPQAEPLPDPWSAADDDVVLRRLWRRVRAASATDAWTSTAHDHKMCIAIDAAGTPPVHCCVMGPRVYR